MTSDFPKFVFAGDRQIAVDVLDYLLAQGHRPLALILPEADKASHSQSLREMCPFLDDDLVWLGRAFREPPQLAKMRSLDLDYVLGIHFPLIVPKTVLELPREGVLNLHPAYLPFSRGWHNSVWAMLERVPYGATLHFMSEILDGGDIVHQKTLEITPEDTANSFYRRAVQLELDVFKEAWPTLVARTYHRTPQDPCAGTTHRSSELYSPDVQRIEPNAMMRATDLLDKLRALTSNRVEEAAYIELAGKRYRYQVTITAEEIT